MGRPSKYSPEVRSAPSGWCFEHAPSTRRSGRRFDPSPRSSGCTAETLRHWVRQAERDSGQRAGPDDRRARAAEGAGARDRRAEARERDSAEGVRVFRPGGARPPTEVMVALHRRASRRLRGRADLRACCRSPRRRTSGTRPSRRDPTRRSARAQRDDELRVEIQRVWDEHQQVYGPRKVWRQLRREGHRRRALHGRAPDARRWACAGAVARPRVDHDHPVGRRRGRGRPISSSASSRRRGRISSGSSDFTYVATWSGFVYVAFVIDVFARRIVGWRVSASLRTDFVLDALEQAIYDRGGADGRRPRASQRSRHAVSLDALHRPAGRRRHRAVGRQPRRFVRQRPRRIGDRPLQDGGDSTTGTVAAARGRGVRHARRGSTGSTRGGCSSRSATCRRQNTKRATMKTCAGARRSTMPSSRGYSPPAPTDDRSSWGMR